jgi:hypothetical protein
LAPTRFILLAALLSLRALAQEGPRYFELLLPDFSDRAYPGGPTTIEHPPRPLERLTIQLLNPSMSVLPRPSPANRARIRQRGEDK